MPTFRYRGEGAVSGETPPAAKGVTEAMAWCIAVCDHAIEHYKGPVARKIRREISVEKARLAALSLPAPGEATPTELINRLQDAIEGECEGLAIDEDQAKAILEHVGYPSTPAAPELAVKDGWVLVPRNPTPDMLVAAGTIEGWNEAAARHADECHIEWWQAMLAAAPVRP